MARAGGGAGGANDPVIEWVVTGGYAGRTKQALRILADGTATLTRAGKPAVTARLAGIDVTRLVARIGALGFPDLPEGGPGPTRSDGNVTTITVGTGPTRHRVRADDLAGDAGAPAALVATDAVLAALALGLAAPR